MKKLLLPLTFICFFVSSTMVAQNTQKKNNSTTKNTQRKGPKMSKNNAVVRINEVPATPSVVSRNSNRSTTRKQRIVESNTSNSRSSNKMASHRDMIAKRKRIVENY